MPNNQSHRVECIECSWQGDYNETDAGHCPEEDCGGETQDLDQIYALAPETDEDEDCEGD